MKYRGGVRAKRKTRTTSREHQLTRALARALVAEADAAEARANEKKTAKIAAFWKAEALQERRVARVAENRMLRKQDCNIHSLTREWLVKALRLLGSENAEERASAALVAEKQRLLLGKTWNELIVRDHENYDQVDDPVDDNPKNKKKKFADGDDHEDFDDGDGIDPDDEEPVA